MMSDRRFNQTLLAMQATIGKSHDGTSLVCAMTFTS